MEVTEAQGCIITLLTLPIPFLVAMLCRLYLKRRYGDDWQEDDGPFIY